MAVEVMAIHMIRLRLDNRRLVDLARKRRLPISDLDTGYIVHCALGELFGEAAPKPFAIQGGSGRGVDVLAYSGLDAEQLRQVTGSGGGSATLLAQGSSIASRQMPIDWRPGARFSFAVRVCPVVRVGRGSPRYRPGSEVDAFLARCTTAGDSATIDRQEVYRSWFTQQMDRLAGARVLRTEIRAFHLERLTRRTHEEQRRSRISTRPDVLVTGDLEVVDSSAFGGMLHRGVGRQRSFGFGMLLLRRARP